jgi:AcrR family transcriptional regulator
MTAVSDLSVNASPDLRSDGARNRERLLEVAQAHLLAGDPTLPMHVIAREAGVGVGTVYRHFPTRQALLEALAAKPFALVVQAAQAAAAEPSPAEGLRRLLAAALEALTTDPSLALVLESPEVACLETTQMLSGLGEAVGTVVSRARAAGLLRDQMGPDDLRKLLLGVRHALVLPGGSPALRDTYLCVLLDGLRQPGLCK